MGIKSVKDKLYYYFAEKNWGVQREYGPYVDAHQEEHRTKRWKHWWLLVRLNWHYRIRRSSDYLLQVPNKKRAPVGPYMDGPESGKRKGTDAYHFALSLKGYDVISFDIFDTLVFRKLNIPADVFMLVGNKLSIYNFYGIRKKAEKEVRQRELTLHGKNDVTLEDIYERVAYYTGIDAAYGAEVEFKTELDMCFASPYMMRVFEILRAEGKRIVATSDMYLSKARMEILLSHCGYDGFEDILVSCDYNCGKKNGGLFQALKSKVGKDKKIVHIGDNKVVDIQGALKAGLDVRYYPPCRAFGDPHRCPGMSPLIESAYRGIVNTTLHNGNEVYSPLWEYGFVYGGLLALGYVNWIHKRAADEGITKILFLSRDSFVLKVIYDLQFHDIPSEYVLWSRIAGLRSAFPGERFPFLRRFVGQLCGTGVTIHEMLDLAALTKLEPLFSEHGLDPEWPLLGEYNTVISDLLVNNWDKVDAILAPIREYTENYLRRVIGDNKKIAVVDVGWTGQSIYPLIKGLNRVGAEKVKNYMLGLRNRQENDGSLLTGVCECYMFHSHFNRDIHDRVRNEEAAGCEPFEKIFTAPQCSVMSFEGNNKMTFALPEAENYSGLPEIEKGVLDFVERYNKCFKNTPELFHIDGYDAYIPIKLLLDNKKATINMIGSLVSTKGINPNNRGFARELLEGKI